MVEEHIKETYKKIGVLVLSTVNKAFTEET